MKIKFLLLITLVLVSFSCSDDDDDSNNEPEQLFGCTDDNALNFNFQADSDDGNCMYSRMTFYAKFNIFQSVPITQIDITIDGEYIGSINGGFIWPNGPGNCSATGTVGYQFLNGANVDWNATIYLANGQFISTSGTKFPNSIECLKVNVTI